MDQSTVPPFEGLEVAIRRKRSQPSRRPRPESQSSKPPSDDSTKVSSDDNIGDTKMFNLNQCVSRSLPVSGSNSGSNVSVSNGDGVGSENKLKKVKLKVGGVTRTIKTKSSSHGASGSGLSAKTNQSAENVRPRQKMVPQENFDEYHSPRVGKKSALQGVPWKDLSKGGFSLKSEGNARVPSVNTSDSVCKSKRMAKKRVLDEEFDEDDEIRYLEKLKTSKITIHRDLEAESSKKQRKTGKYENNLEDIGRNLSYEEAEELPSENKKELALTTRQRALLSKDDTSSATQIEFPNGLPPAPSRKQKEILTEVEQQMKKAEAAQRRRMQNEKAARESEAEAIRRILGQDSSRKKREEKMKKRREELAQEKAANANVIAFNTVRLVLGPTGTIVTFSQDMGLPKLFDSKPCGYPPPREKCAVPSCTNPYRYRDSKSKLPLCSLQCYKAINGETLKFRRPDANSFCIFD